DGDYVWSGSFMFQVYDVTGGNGTFSGKAFAMVPYLSYVKLAAEFRNIKVNTDNQVYEGEIKSVYNPNSPFFVTVDLDGEDYNTENDSIITTGDDGLNDTTFVADIDSIYIDGDDIIILNEDGTTDTIHTTDDIIITDSNGDTWIVENGDVIVGDGNGPGGSPDGTTGDVPVVNAFGIKIKLEFLPYDKQEYGFDKLTYDVHKDMYEQASVYGENVFLPWKSLAAASMDRVLVKFSDYDTTISPDKVKFRTNNGVALTSFENEGKKDERLVLMNGGANQTVESIEAYVAYKDTSDKNQELVVGMYKTISYEKKNVNIVIVPVNGTAGFSVGDFTEALNDIYKQAAISWTVTLQSQFDIEKSEWDKDDDGKLNDGETTLLSCYSDEQNKVIKKYKSDRDIDNESYYVFLLDGINSKTGLAGYMPLKKQVAFIYDGNTDARTSLSAGRLIAHELGHGAFRLWHTFSSENKYAMSQNSTDNLMDYNNGQRLHKYQWDFIQNPEAMIAWGQDEEEGALITEGTDLTIDIKGLNDDFEPGKKELKIEYEIKNFEKIAEEHKDVTKAYIWILKDNTVVYTSDLPLKNINTFIWNGKSNKDNVENDIVGLNDFIIKIGVTIEYSIVSNIFEWLFTSNVDFKLTSSKEQKWAVNKFEKEFDNFILKDQHGYTQTNILGSYVALENRLNQVGAKELSPMEYLSNHIVEGDFLGTNIPAINIRYLYVLRKLEESIGRNKKWNNNNSTFKNIINELNSTTNSDTRIENFARFSLCNSSLSDHALGFAIDFDKNRNIWLRSSENQNTNQSKFIEIVTEKMMIGGDYSNSSDKGAKEINQSHLDFLSRINDNNVEFSYNNIQSIYNNLNTYSSSIELLDNFRANSLNNSKNQLYSLLNNEQPESNEEFLTYINNIVEQCSQLKLLIEDDPSSLQNIKLLIDNSKKGLFLQFGINTVNYDQLYSFVETYTQNINTIINMLDEIINGNWNDRINWNAKLIIWNNSLNNTEFNDYQATIDRFKTNFNSKIGIFSKAYVSFANGVKSETDNSTNYSGKLLFNEGFCKLHSNVIKNICTTSISIDGNKTVKLLWGGSAYVNSKDFMHFELRDKPQDNRNYQQWVHEIDLEIIKNYLNSFNKPDGSEYNY
ncbi:MAG TPA: hypothetical protein DCQ24_04345, partial [Bacteroidales bacterium]|nr:hypothetical protein [Bacteroidales bacterium]